MKPPSWTALPFVALLLSIALLPLARPTFWHRNRNKAIVAAALSLPVVLLLPFLGQADAFFARPGLKALGHSLEEYFSFIILLGSLYVVTGGIAVKGNLIARPWINTSMLACGAVLANLIGTTGASMLLIRVVLQSNKERQHRLHLPLCFIFVVSNTGGLLTPIGDPPLFLGFLRGVEFSWTLRLWPQWLVMNAWVLTLFYFWDRYWYRKEPIANLVRDLRDRQPLRIRGKVNFLLLLCILLAVLLQSPVIGAAIAQVAGLPPIILRKPAGEILMLASAAISWLATPQSCREANDFTWSAILEVAILFAGIFITMIPALAWLGANAARFGVQGPWANFWLTGALSSVLDNAPTYLTFASLASGDHGLVWLMHRYPKVLEAISCGAVFMGANTYIGNGTNFMVKAIAEQAGYPMPSFFSYLLYAAILLGPAYWVIAMIWFR